ncbi:MAG: hypothetical protein QOE93_2513, partial [Actinomycetota bacterium]|nr:hypothetical protein [Actinomycetota bacterium]
DDNDGDLYNWWSALATRDPEDNFPLSDEQDLFALLPAGYGIDNCSRGTKLDEDTEVASLVCYPDDGADTVFFTSFTDAAALKERYDSIVSDVGGVSGSGIETCPGEDFYTFTSTGAEGGRVLCYLEGSDARVTWTQNIDLVLAEGIRSDGDSVALLDWWEDVPIGT